MVDNETLRQLSARKSVRVFTEEPVTAEERAAILEAAFQAPTAGNQQLYTILDITDPELRRTMADLCDHQPMIAQAPLCLVFLADCRRWPRAYRAAGVEIRDPGPGDLLLAVADSCIAAQNAVTAAESLGIGSCYIGDVLENCEAVRAALHLPPQVVPAAMLIFGRPTQQQKDRKKPTRFPAEAVVCENVYRDRTEEELRADFAARAGGEYDFDAKIPPFCAFKYNSDFSREMSRSAAVYLKDFPFGVE
ncbi:nitroreductase family protein [Gemmiger formicilis]|uniref:nitroreductase family protein n=1 Tax=Gemmiger formicilis TaxID=745368 RepID=UPI00195D50C4|nr:nitroreductase family protein [Gemmiger formicilis]MBM6716876.1 nitroreductase family protein [Gemmiger formicilis]